MTWTVAAARVRLGLDASDDSQDAAIAGAMALALSAAESYCDRPFLLADDADNFAAPIGRSLNVRRYPLEALLGVSPLAPHVSAPPAYTPAPAGWLFDSRRGIVYLHGGAVGVAPVGSTPLPAGCGAGFTLAYRGGYAPDKLPADLEAALWLAFDSVWNKTPGWGAAAGSDASAAGVKSFGIDGMSITYGDTSSSGSGAGAAPAAWGFLPAAAVAVLNFYRAESAALGA